MNQQEFAVARELKNKCIRKVPVLDVRVFGSRVRADNRPDSDLDIYRVVERLDRSIRRIIQDTAWELGLDYSTIIAPVVFSKVEVEQASVRYSPFLEAVREEGIPV
jgi:uncharacterized protein